MYQTEQNRCSHFDRRQKLCEPDGAGLGQKAEILVGGLTFLRDSNVTDLYTVLGVNQDATADEIKAAYRKLAKKLHPDLNPSDAEAESRFKAVAAAFDILGDPDKRAQYDRGEINESGHERPEHRYYKQYADQDDAAQYRRGGGFEDLGDIFGDVFGRRGGGAEYQMRGRDTRYYLTVEFIEAAKGARKRITLPDGSSLDVDVPEGLQDGQTIRLKGKGEPGFGGGPPGDALIEITVRSHSVFTREKDDIVMELPITIDEAILGAKVQVPTLDGPVRVTVPKGASSGTTLRLKGKGVRNRRTGKRGAQKCVLKLVLPDTIDKELEGFIEEWRASHAYDPRQGAKSP